ncbi:MAG: DUF6488 family protein [Gammaproteobacteria bacterium]|nr:DUF6488 family protein [Gammaproteobacteria bacterium]
MRIQAIIFSFILSLSPAAVLAGANHDHGHSHSHEPVNQSQAEQVAIKSVAQLVEKGKIDGSWKSVNIAKSEKKEFGGNMEWMISFTNDKISDPEKQTLYVFLSLNGEYIAANYTGK